MNPAAFLCCAADRFSAEARPFQWFSQSQDTHTRRRHEAVLVKRRRHALVTGRQSLLSTGMTRLRQGPSGFFQEETERDRSPERDAATAPEHV